MTNTWQKIETAPRDKKDILVFEPTHKEMFVAWFDNGFWTYAMPEENFRVHCEPTHWMPLPPPPTEQNEIGG